LPQASIWQTAEHVSPASQETALPESQVSPHSVMPSPQTSSVREQSPWHPSQSAVLPSSHSSHGVSSRPLPHTTSLQAFEQASQLLMLPSSHSSPFSVMPSRSHEPGPPQRVTSGLVATVGLGTMVAPVSTGAGTLG
jgi:hypothetical protein